jgi:hypothetical protein
MCNPGPQQKGFCQQHSMRMLTRDRLIELLYGPEGERTDRNMPRNNNLFTAKGIAEAAVTLTRGRCPTLRLLPGKAQHVVNATKNPRNASASMKPVARRIALRRTAIMVLEGFVHMLEQREVRAAPFRTDKLRGDSIGLIPEPLEFFACYVNG